MKILIADEYRLMRDGLRPFLSELSPIAHFFDASTLNEAISVAADAGEIDLVLLSQAMPGMNDVSGIRSFREGFPKGKVVLLSTIADPLTMVEALVAGAVGVIPKTSSMHSLVSALRLVISGEVYLPSEAAIALSNRSALPVSTNRPSAPENIGMVRFSSSESKVLPLLLDGLSNKVIAERLGIEEAAVKARMRCIYRKIGVANRAQAVWALQANGNLRTV
ncbi:MAG TPA: response regulator transcription factor [Patescibacteria group bacterium]|nr:response regulator transcription factor [Patescibacteria group bacterium]